MDQDSGPAWMGHNIDLFQWLPDTPQLDLMYLHTALVSDTSLGVRNLTWINKLWINEKHWQFGHWELRYEEVATIEVGQFSQIHLPVHL